MDIWEPLCILSSALMVALFSGPRIALSRSFKVLNPRLVVGIADHLSKNMTPIITVLMPISVLSMFLLLIKPHRASRLAFGLNSVAFGLIALSLVVALVFEIPVLNEIAAWESAIPENWHQRRDHWIYMHKIRVFSGFGSLSSLIVATIVAHLQ